MVGNSDVDSYFTIRGPLPSRSDPRYSLFPEPVHSQRRFYSTSRLTQYHNRGFLSHHPQDSRRCPVSLRMARWSCIFCSIWMSVVFLFPSNRACLPTLFRYHRFHFEPIPGRLRDPVPFQPVKAGIALPSDVGRESPCGVRYGPSGG